MSELQIVKESQNCLISGSESWSKHPLESWASHLNFEDGITKLIPESVVRISQPTVVCIFFFTFQHVWKSGFILQSMAPENYSGEAIPLAYFLACPCVNLVIMVCKRLFNCYLKVCYKGLLSNKIKCYLYAKWQRQQDINQIIKGGNTHCWKDSHTSILSCKVATRFFGGT